MTQATGPGQKLAELQQHYDRLLHKLLEALRQYEHLPADKATRENHVQHLITTLEFALEEMQNDAFQNAWSDKGKDIPLGLHGIPTLPADESLVEQSLFEDIKQTFQEKIRLTQNDPLVIQGESGCGKSLLAARLARDPILRQAFPDGVIWLRLGHEPDLRALQQQLMNALRLQGGETLVETGEAAEFLREAMSSRACLLILDDAWEIEDVSALNVVGVQCQWLITTRNPELFGFIKFFGDRARLYEIPAFSAEQSRDYFLGGLGWKPEAVPVKHLAQLTDFCRGNPLALKLVAGIAAIQGRPDWPRLLSRLQEEEYEFPDDYPRYLMQALHCCLEELGEEADYYLVLAVFPEPMHIPEETVLMLWQHMFQVQASQGRELLADYLFKGMLSHYQVKGKPYYALHAFQHAYVHEHAEVEKLHQHVLSAYRRQAPQGWVVAPEDDYFQTHLALHLASAGRNQELKNLLLDLDWLRRRVGKDPYYAILNDYLLVNDPDLMRAHQALYAAIPTLAQDQAFLAQELLDRLWENPSREIQALLNQAKEIEPNWTPPFPDMEDNPLR